MKKIIYAFVFLLFVSPVFSLSNYTYTSNSTYTVPSGVEYLYVEVWGGGGQGASCAANAQVGGGGGGGGGFSQQLISVSPGNLFTVTVGAQTSLNNPGANAGPNGLPSVFNGTLVNITAGGGIGGNTTPAGNIGGAGGNGSTTNGGTGGTGGIGNTGVGFGAGGGGSAGTYQSGGSGGSTYANVSGGGSGGIAGQLFGGRGGAGAIADAIGAAGVSPGGGGGGAYCDGASSAVRGGFGARGEIRVTEFNSTEGLIVNVYDANTNTILTVPVNLSLNGQNGDYYFLNNSYGAIVNNSIPYGIYSAIVSANGYNPNYALISVFGQVVYVYVDASAQSRLFNVRNGFGQAVPNATISLTRSIGGNAVAYTQLITDSTGYATFYLNPNILYLVTGTESSGSYLNYTGSVLPNQDITYVIQFSFSPNEPYVNPSNDTYTQINATYNNVSKVVNVTWETISPIGDLQYFGLRTTYNGVNYSQNITGIPGGGIAFVNITNVNLSVQDTILVYYWFKRTGYDEELFASSFYFVDYNPYNSSIFGGMFENQNAPTTSQGKILLGMIIVIIMTAASYHASKQNDIAAFTAIITVGVLSAPGVSIMPLLYGVITVVVGGVLLLVKILRGA